MIITCPEPPGPRELARLVLDRTIALCGIPAPPRHEQVATGLAALAATVARLDEQEW
jgi:hypothetical protein